MLIETRSDEECSEYAKRRARFEELRASGLSSFNARARVAVEILKSKGLEEYTSYVVNWSSVYKFHWQMFAFEKALVEELKDG